MSILDNNRIYLIELKIIFNNSVENKKNCFAIKMNIKDIIPRLN